MKNKWKILKYASINFIFLIKSKSKCHLGQNSPKCKSSAILKLVRHHCSFFLMQRTLVERFFYSVTEICIPPHLWIVPNCFIEVAWYNGKQTELGNYKTSFKFQCTCILGKWFGANYIIESQLVQMEILLTTHQQLVQRSWENMFKTLVNIKMFIHTTHIYLQRDLANFSPLR